MTEYPIKENAQLIIQYCVAFKIENVVISPGSRNAPLTIGFVNHPLITALSIVDERCAAFFALGIAKQKRKPVVLLCTSGSALLNYYPAVAEAFYSNIPLIIISADRPNHLIDIGDGQTIRQKNVFSNHILYSGNLLTELDSLSGTNNEENKLKNRDVLNKAFEIVIDRSGPVHINVSFDEPLYETLDKWDTINIDEYKVSKHILLEETPIDVEELQYFADIWTSSSKKMVLIGTDYPDDLLTVQLQKIIEDESVIVLTESTSNLYNKNFINSIDKVIFSLEDGEKELLKPEILLTLGGMIVSKKIKQYLRNYQPTHHWHVDKLNSRNTFHCLSHDFKISPQLFFSQFFFLLNNSVKKNNGNKYQRSWLQIKSDKNKKHKEFMENLEFSDLQVFETILNEIPRNTHVHLANSSVIRYAQLFNLNNSLKLFCNRGTSGIEGSTSTAMGAAYAESGRTILITGDISFFYDSNALWNNYIKNDFRIILINNSGGGIFRFIPGPKNSKALNYFETPHQLDASHLCKMYELDYTFVSNNLEIKLSLDTFFNKSERPKLLEINTPRLINDKVLKAYFEFLNKD